MSRRKSYNNRRNVGAFWDTRIKQSIYSGHDHSESITFDDALGFIDEVHRIDCIANEEEGRRELEGCGDEILRRNKMIFYSGVMNQAFPINRQVGGRWFDEIGWSHEVLENAARKVADAACCGAPLVAQ